jgi:hypothetical protein
VGTLLADGAVTLDVLSPLAKPIVWSISACARDVMDSALSAAATNTARRASIENPHSAADEPFMTDRAIMVPVRPTNNYNI